MPGRSVSVILSANVSGYIAELNRAGAATEAAMGRANRATTSHGAAWKATAATVKYASVGVAGGIALAVKESADFEERMANVKTLAHASASEMLRLRSAAQSAGQGYGYTATEVADAQAEMIKAGVGLRDILGGGLKGTLALAAAGQIDVADATTIAASAMTQFRLKGRDLPHVADLLAAGADKALGSVSDLGFGLDQTGTTAHQMGISIEDTVGTLAAFAQAGQQGEKGGTLLNQTLLQLSAPTKQAKKLMDQYGLSLYDANGQIKTLPELAGNLQRSFEHLTPAQRNAALGTIFGSRAIRGANILMSEGEKGITRWVRKVNDQGFAAEQASGKLDSLKGDLQKFKAEGVNDLIALGSGAQSPLRGIVDDATHELARLRTSGDLERFGKNVGHVIETAAHDIKTFAQDVGPAVAGIARGVHFAVQEFDKIPSDLRKLLLYGGAGAVVAQKVGVGSLVTNRGTRALSGSALGGRGGGVVPVYVTNLGKGSPLLPGDPLGGPGGGKKPPKLLTDARGLLAGFAFLGPTVGAIGNETSDKHGNFFGTRAIDPNKTSHALGGGKITDVKDLQKLDATYAKLMSRHPEKTFDQIQTALKRAGVPTRDLNALLPRTADLMRDTAKGGKVGAAALQELLGGAARTSSGLKQLGLSAGDYSARLKTLPKGVSTTIEAPGAKKSIGEIQALTTRYKLTPKQVRTLASLTDHASGTIHTVQGGLVKLDRTNPRPKVTVGADISGARAAQSAIDSVHGKSVEIAIYRKVYGAKGSSVRAELADRTPSVDGSLWDGPMRMFAPGGFTDTGQYVPRVSQMRQGGGNILWSEPETGWEAYISGKPGMRDRNLRILAAAADRLGATVEYAAGGITPMASGGSRGGSAHSREEAHKRLAKAINRVTDELGKMRDKLHETRAARNDYARTVSAAFIGDPFGGTLGGFDSQVRYESGRLRGVRADERTLRKNGLSGALYKDLFASGNATLIDQFAHLSKAEIARRERDYNARNRLDQQIGNRTANRVYDRRIDHLSNEVHGLTHELRTLRKGHHIGNHTTNIHRATIKDSDKKTRTKRAAQRARHS